MKRRDGNNLATRAHLLGVERFAIVPQGLIGYLETAREHKVFGTLAVHANEHSEAWPSVATISEITGLDRRAVQTTLRTLEVDAYILSFPAQGPGGTSVYRLQPDPRLFCDAHATKDDGPGGYLVGLAYTMLLCLYDAGLRVAVRTRRPNERNEYIEHLNTACEPGDEPKRTPGIRLFIENPERFAELDQEKQRWFPRSLDSLELWLADNLVPWSVFRAALYQLESRREGRPK